MACDELLLMVLEAVANDFERLQDIESQIASWTVKPLDQLDRERIRATLYGAINLGYVAVFELTSTPPHVVELPSASANLDQHWFLITRQGKAKACETNV